MHGERLHETHVGQAELNRNRAVIKTVAMCIAVIGTAMCLISFVSSQKPPGVVGMITIGYIFCNLLAYAIATHTDHIRLAGWIIAVTILSTFVTITAIMGGIKAPIVLGLLLAPLAATLVLPFRSALIVLGGSMAAIAYFIVAEKMGVRFPDHGMTEAQKSVRGGIWILLCMVVSFISIWRYNHFNQQYSLDLSEKAATDQMTGFYSKDVAETLLYQQVQVSKRTQAPLSVVLLDIDWFKQINDSFGHREGDRYIARVAEIIKQEVQRSSDVLGRVGGDEFMILLPQTQAEGAKRITDNIAMRVASIPLPAEINGQLHLSMRIGALVYNGHPAYTHEDVYRTTDEALYAAKAAGRNRRELAVIEQAPSRIVAAA